MEFTMKYLVQSYHNSEKAQYEARRRKRELEHKEKANSSANPFLILSKRDKEGLYHVFLANPSDIPYTKVKKLTGAFASDGDNLMETSKAVFDLPELSPHSSIEIDTIDYLERDFTVWYQLDLCTEQRTWKYLSGSVPKRLSDDDIKSIDQFKKEGWILELQERSDSRSIDEVAKTMHMESRYITYEEKE